jgi:hypothetical protein
MSERAVRPRLVLIESTTLETSTVTAVLSAKALTPITPESRIIGEAKPAPVEKLMMALITGIVTVTPP